MYEIYPDYYKKFRCTASGCRHSCCENWEIDIDDESLYRYRSLTGPLSEKISKNIAEDGDGIHSIKLMENGRCPFLDSDNLCELIKEYGENVLCDICREHPRFHNFYGDITESGLGLCCEESARIIITNKCKVSYVKPPDFTDISTEISDTRKTVFDILHNGDYPYNKKISGLLSYCGLCISGVDVISYIRFISGLEIMDSEWKILLNDFLKQYNDVLPPCTLPLDELFFSNILEYYVYRYFPQFCLGADQDTIVGFSVLSSETIRYLCIKGFIESGYVSDSDLINYARMYSSEIEYSDCNMDDIFDYLYDVNMDSL